VVPKRQKEPSVLQCKIPKEHRLYGLTISALHACMAKFHLWNI